jgi:hypothetical protein
MTTIVYSHGKLYSDTRTAVYIDGIFSRYDTIQKIYKMKNYVFAGAGNTKTIDIFKNRFHLFLIEKFGITVCSLNEWILQNSNKSTVLVFKSGVSTVYELNVKKIFGNISRVSAMENSKYKLGDGNWCAFGSGGVSASRLLMQGHDGYKAIKVAASEDPYTNDRIDCLDLRTDV